MKTRFSRKLHMAFAAMLAVTLALAWHFYDRVQSFEHDIERITIANSVLNGHRTLATETKQKLRLINESVAAGAIADLPRWHENLSINTSGQARSVALARVVLPAGEKVKAVA